MNWYRLSIRGFINPLWFNQVKNGEHQGQVIAADQIELEGQRLDILRNDDTPSLEVGQTVIVRCGLKHLEFTTLEENHARALEQAKKKEQEKERERQAKNKRKEEAEAFNAQFHIPVSWSVAIKPVLSGLLENSWGDGSKKNTVYHILLNERLEDGRLIRHAGDFLCSSKSENGKFYDLVELLEHMDGEGNMYTPKVTCKACIKTASRWK